MGAVEAETKFNRIAVLRWQYPKSREKEVLSRTCSPRLSKILPTTAVIKDHKRTTSTCYVLLNQDSPNLPLEYWVK